MGFPRLPVNSLSYPLKVLGLMMAVQFLLRAIFWAYNLHGAGDYTWSEGMMAVLVGFRFDYATLCITAGFPLLFLSLPTGMLRRHATYRVLNIVLACILFLLTFVNCIDVVYYGFASKRITHELFSTKDDLSNFGIGDILPYWWLVIVWWGSSILAFLMMKRWARKAQGDWREMGAIKKWHWIAPVILLGGLFLGMRGGWQLRPLRPANAFVTSSFFLGNVSLNTGYTIISAIDIGKEKPVEFMPMEDAVAITRKWYRNDFDGEFVSDEYPLVRKAEFPGPERKYNVVLLIVESFNALKTGSIQGIPLEKSLTPNFDTLARKGRLFTNFYSNGSRSIESLPALLNSLPDIFSRPTIGSSYETNSTWGIGNILQSKGYHTSFFCGGENGTMGFDSYSMVSGIHHYYGMNEFPSNGTHIKSNWGVHDLPFANWMADMHGSFKKPFFSVWFSISNHFPFSKPEDCPQEITQRNLSPNDLTLMYSDHALGKYFEKVRSTDWADSTIFLITGDHCFYAAEDPPRAFMTNFQVPLLILGPGVEPGVETNLGAHLNIPPTLLELLRLDIHHAFAGVSLLTKENKTSILNNLMGILNFATDTISYSTNFDKVQPCFRGKNGQWVGFPELQNGGPFQPSTTSDGHVSYDRILRAIYQVCSHARIENKVIHPDWMK